MYIYISLLCFIIGINTSLIAMPTDDQDQLSLVVKVNKKSSKTDINNNNSCSLAEDIDEVSVIRSTIASSIASSVLDYILIDHRRLVTPYQIAMRSQFIEQVASPNFYSIFYRGLPLMIFIFPTDHILPLEAIPPYIRRFINAIANTSGSVLYMECIDEDDDSNDDDEENVFSIRDPREKLNVEKVIQQELDYYTSYARKIYVNDESDDSQIQSWNNALTRRQEELQKTFEGGWTQGLSEPVKQYFIKSNPNALAALDTRDPTCFYSRICNAVFEEERPCIYGLDSAIFNIFLTRKRELRSLELEENRDDAFDQQVWLQADNIHNKYIPLDVVLSLSNSYLEKTIRHWEYKNSQGEEESAYYPTLDDVNFSNPLTFSFLTGNPSVLHESVSLNERNNLWWKDSIYPLLRERSKNVSRTTVLHTEPALLMYGAAHNQGSASILDRIRKLKGFEIYSLTRKGFQKH